MKEEINLINGIIEDWHNLADYDGKEKDGEELDKAWDKIQKAINYLTKNRTTIVIAHRLSTILNSDKIYVIDMGKVVGEGNHKELLDSSEVYKNFYEKQIQK